MRKSKLLSLVSGCVLLVFLGAMPANAQKWADVLRSALRAAQQPNASRPVGLPPSRGWTGGPRGGGTATVEFPVATVTVLLDCSAGGDFVVRYKVDRRTLRHETLYDDLAATETYMGLLEQAMLKASPMRGIPVCPKADVRVVGVDGQEILRDTLRGDSGKWVSDRVAAGQVALASGPVTSAEGFALGDLKKFDELMLARRRIVERAIATNCRQQRDYDACKSKEESDEDRPYVDLLAGVKRFIAAQPVSYDGLRNLRSLETKFGAGIV